MAQGSIKLVGTVLETIVVQKDVEVEVSKDATREQIVDAIRKEAYRQTIFENDDDVNGWQCDDSLDENVLWVKK